MFSVQYGPQIRAEELSDVWTQYSFPARFPHRSPTGEVQESSAIPFEVTHFVISLPTKLPVLEFTSMEEGFKFCNLFSSSLMSQPMKKSIFKNKINGKIAIFEKLFRMRTPPFFISI